MTKEVLVVVASLLALVGNIPYVLDVVKGRVKPHPYTWFVWTIVSGVVFFGQLIKGAGIAVIATGVSEIFTVIIFLLSLKYGFKNPPRIDKYFLSFALLGLVPWFITKDPTISVITVVLIDLIAFFPTLRKTYCFPKSESPLLYGSNVLRHSLILTTLGAYNIATMLHSISMIVTNSIMVIFITTCKEKPTKSESPHI
ncbi:hypothetical protein K8Q98_01835 [Candidatus Nomurabacteria bacterium]|nr:hypothetical protein [Candidatus Nomurabacteria bacterium]